MDSFPGDVSPFFYKLLNLFRSLWWSQLVWPKPPKWKKWTKRADTLQNKHMTGWKISIFGRRYIFKWLFLVVMLVVFGWISTWRWMSARIGCLSEFVFLGRGVLMWQMSVFLWGAQKMPKLRKKNMRSPHLLETAIRAPEASHWIEPSRSTQRRSTPLLQTSANWIKRLWTSTKRSTTFFSAGCGERAHWPERAHVTSRQALPACLGSTNESFAHHLMSPAAIQKEAQEVAHQLLPRHLIWTDLHGSPNLNLEPTSSFSLEASRSAWRWVDRYTKRGGLLYSAGTKVLESTQRSGAMCWSLLTEGGTSEIVTFILPISGRVPYHISNSRSTISGTRPTGQGAQFEFGRFGEFWLGWFLKTLMQNIQMIKNHGLQTRTSINILISSQNTRP